MGEIYNYGPNVNANLFFPNTTSEVIPTEKFASEGLEGMSTLLEVGIQLNPVMGKMSG